MNTEIPDEPLSSDKPKRPIRRNILLFLSSTCWIINGNIPLIPIGAILGVAICRPKKPRIYLLVLVAALIGFIGTGLHVTLAKVKRINVDTGAELYVNQMNAGVRFGAGTIDYFKNKGKVFIYDDPSYESEVNKANEYVSQFIEHYNAGDSSFMLDSFVYQQGITREQVQQLFTNVQEAGGKITSFEYLGYNCWVYPNQEHADISVIHKVKFEHETEWGSIAFRTIFFPEGLKLTQISFVKKTVEYRVIKGMIARNPFMDKK